MLKYKDVKVVFQEIPNEITLAINITNCPCHCIGCHSSYLAENMGEELDFSEIDRLVNKNEGITCIAFMGGDSDPNEVNSLAFMIRSFSSNVPYNKIKIAWYSGRQELSKYINLYNFDYIKLGPYIREKGPLTSKTTNQRLYKVKFDDLSPEGNKLIDITYKFWK